MLLGGFFFNTVHFHYPAWQAPLNTGPLQPHAPQGPKGCWVPGVRGGCPRPGGSHDTGPCLYFVENPPLPLKTGRFGGFYFRALGTSPGLAHKMNHF